MTSPEAAPRTAEGRALLADRMRGFDEDAKNHALPSRGPAWDVNRAMLKEDWLERILAIEAEAAAGTALDRGLLQRIGNRHIMDVFGDGLSDGRWEAIAAEYARLAGEDSK